MKRNFVRGALAALAMGVSLGGQTASAQDDLPAKPSVKVDLVDDVRGKEKPGEQKEEGEKAPPEVGEYWLGIQLGELTDALKAQLGLESGVVVVQVVPESPASKAEVKPFDVVIEVSGKKIQEPLDLVAVVNESKGKELDLSLIRGAKTLALKVTPTKRPEGQRMAAGQEGSPQDSLAWLEGFFKALPSAPGQPGQPPIVLWQAQPPMTLQAEQFHFRMQPLKLPKNVSVQIMKTGEEPARVVVRRDDKTYEGTEGKLDEIPSDLRPHVERMMGGGGGWSLMAPHVRIFNNQHGIPHIAPRDASAPPALPMPQIKPLERRQQVRTRAEERIQEARPGAAKAEQELSKKMEAVLERLEKLQADVDALKK